MKLLSAVMALLALVAANAMADTTNGLSDKEIQGHALAQKMLAQWPVENFTNAGVLKIRSSKKHDEFPLKYTVTITPTNWVACYWAQLATNSVTKLAVTHDGSESNHYEFFGDETEQRAFAGSDFSAGDLGLEFVHWPQQKVLKREVHSSRGCTVLESTNPSPSPDSYSRVMSWIDTETLGIVEAYAYDAKGKQLKDFYPKDFTKINGQWQVQTFVMENVQTGSRSRIEFDLKH
ncbi:MAG TPA: outer membrane lipoprotein-sorting protein [Verrucomicrobiae bacterium]|nr:outer membrane lipoprotein-sorting protein [Verrucomicrobiae bacterium]